jgi:hypothetical protein
MATPHAAKITSRELADVLRHEKNVLLLKRFMGKGSTVASAAQAADLPFHTVYRFAKQMERLGLLQVTTIQARAGRAMKVYLCPNKRFFIPKSLFSLEELFWDTYLPILQAIQSNLASAFEAGTNGVRGVVVGDLPANNWMTVADARGVPWPDETWGPTSSSPPAFIVDHEMQLDYEKAQSFSRELFALVERYRAENGSGKYQFLLMMAPQKG